MGFRKTRFPSRWDILAPFGAMMLAATASHAATITIVSVDGSGEGINDVTPAETVGNNTAPTVGLQRLFAARHAADIWARQLQSDVEIRVRVSFDPLPCDSDGAVLAQAGPNCAHIDFQGARHPNTVYLAALANKMHGSDLCPPGGSCACSVDEDIEIYVNSLIGSTDCTFGAEWYYGLDGNPDTSRDEIDFVTVFLHELAHGLGFLTFVDGNSGERFFRRNDAFMRHLRHAPTGQTWDRMSFDVLRSSAAVDNFNLHWAGPETTASTDHLQWGRDENSGEVFMYAPEHFQRGSSVSHFDISVYPNELMEPWYMGPNHDLGLAADLMRDIGWGAPATCGDGIVDDLRGETCDDAGDSATCDANCTVPTCGDAYWNAAAGEECDDGVDSPVCDADCTVASCGDGHINPVAGETCDDGNTVDGDGCDSNCTPTGCGNSVTTSGEGCDAGRETASCDLDCSPASCGDGYRNVAAGEACDDGGDSAACDQNCSVAVCGDGYRNGAAGESCDDGNNDNEDGCDSNCRITACGNGVLTGSEGCDDGNITSGDGCDANCTEEIGWICAGEPSVCTGMCGDGIRVRDEECEDANNVDGDGCDSNCRVTGCGNGIVTDGESCDDGRETASCDADCTPSSCGDGHLNTEAGELCDEGGETASCTALCTVPQCGDGEVTEAAGEECDGEAGCDGNCT